MFTPDLHLLGVELAEGGFVGREPAVSAVARAARRMGLCPILADVLADPTEPEPARLRAFGRLAVALSSATVTPSVSPAPPVVRPAA